MSPGKYPGSSGARNLSDNMSDLRAQVAANQKVNYMISPNICIVTVNIHVYRGLY